MKKRILSMLLAVLMVVSLAPITAFAEGNPVNIVGGSSYANVQNAVDNATNEQTIQLNTTCTENVTIPEGKTVTIDLNGNVLRGTGSGSVITVSNGATLTLQDSNPTATHSDEFASLPAGGIITGGSANNGGGVFVANNATFTMTGGNIVGNASTGAGGGVSVAGDATFTMTGGTISGNTSNDDSGGGVFVNQNATFTMNGGTISNNTAYFGGGVFVSCSFTMTGGTISNNTAYFGGGVYVNIGAFKMTGGTISGNTSTSAGGVYVGSDGTVTLGGTAKITGNKKGTGESAVEQNVYLSNGKTVTLGTDTEAPAVDMRVGVTTQTPPTGENSVVFTGNCVIYTDKYFFSDNLDYCVRDVRSNADTGHLELSGKYDLWVNNIQVTVDNKNDVLGEADGDGATVTYDDVTKTLTLNGARFANGNDVLDYKKGVRSSIDELTVVLKGHSEIGSYFGGQTGSADESKYSIGEGFDCGELLRFVGDGSLTIYDSQAGIRAGKVEFGTEDEPFAGKLTIMDCGYVELPEPEPPCAISALESVTINGGTFNLTSYTSNGIAAENININDCTEIKVKGAVNVEGAHAVNANTSLTIADTLEVINSTYTKGETTSLDPADGNENDGYVIIKPKAAHTHNLVKVDGQAATEEAAGWKDYYKCDCGKLFEDATCKVEITDLDAWKAAGGNGHIAKLEEEPTSPQTGDNSHLLLWIAIASGSLFLFVLLLSKRRKEETEEA